MEWRGGGIAERTQGRKFEGRDAGRGQFVRAGGGDGAGRWRWREWRRGRRWCGDLAAAAAAAGGLQDDNQGTKQGEAAASAVGTGAARRGAAAVAAAEAAVGLPPCSSLSSHLREEHSFFFK